MLACYAPGSILLVSNTDWHPQTNLSSLSLSLVLRPTVCLGIKHPSGAYDQIVITVRQLRVCGWWALSLTRGQVCRLQLLLALTSADIFKSDSHGTHDHNLLSQIRDFPFRRLLRLAGLRWRYSTPPPHGSIFSVFFYIIKYGRIFSIHVTAKRYFWNKIIRFMVGVKSKNSHRGLVKDNRDPVWIHYVQ
jgi:hypothetical protein